MKNRQHNGQKKKYKPFLALLVLRQSVENIPSVQSLVATSRRPNICGAVMALGFILISLCGAPQSVMAFIKMWIQQDLPAPLGPRVIIPCLTRWVSNNWISFNVHDGWFTNLASSICLLIAASSSGYPPLSSWMPGNKSLIRDKNRGSSWSISLDKFISRKTLITQVFSVSSLLARLTVPRVLSTDKILRNPKS